MRRIRVFGDSHVTVLRAAAQTSGLLESSAEVDFYSRHGLNCARFKTIEDDGRIRLRSSRALNSKPLDYTIDSLEDVYIFSSPLHSARAYRNKAWQSFCPWRCNPANPDLHAVSDAVLESWFSRQVRRRHELLAKLKDRGYRIAVVEPPKPSIRASAMHDIRSDVLIAVDQAYRGVVTATLESVGVDVIPVPAHTHADGFTTQVYSSSDPDDRHHGNERFGTEMMERIIEYASRSS